MVDDMLQDVLLMTTFYAKLLVLYVPLLGFFGFLKYYFLLRSLSHSTIISFIVCDIHYTIIFPIVMISGLSYDSQD